MSKFRAGRYDDAMDLQLLAKTCGQDIDWDEIAHLSKNDAELVTVRDMLERAMKNA